MLGSELWAGAGACCPPGVLSARWAWCWEGGPFPPFRLHNPRIVDSLVNFPGSTSCSEGGGMTDGCGWGCRDHWAGGAGGPPGWGRGQAWPGVLCIDHTLQGALRASRMVWAGPDPPTRAWYSQVPWPHHRLAAAEEQAGGPQSPRLLAQASPAELGQLQGGRATRPRLRASPLNLLRCPINRQRPCASAQPQCPLHGGLRLPTDRSSCLKRPARPTRLLPGPAAQC